MHTRDDISSINKIMEELSWDVYNNLISQSTFKFDDNGYKPLKSIKRNY